MEYCTGPSVASNIEVTSFDIDSITEIKIRSSGYLIGLLV